MEVLEHALGIEAILNKFVKILTSSGIVLISVLVETGIPLIIKQAVRHVAGWRKIGDYPGSDSYTISELCKSIFTGTKQHITRPKHHSPDGTFFHCHKGFNWMALREIINHKFCIEYTTSSPLPFSPHVSSQVWFLARKK